MNLKHEKVLFYYQIFINFINVVVQKSIGYFLGNCVVSKYC